MFWMRAYPLRGQVGGGWALEFENFWALWNGIELIGERHLGPKKLEISRAQPMVSWLRPSKQLMQKQQSLLLQPFSVPWFGTEFRDFSVPRKSRNSAGTNQLFRLFRLLRNNFLSEIANPKGPNVNLQKGRNYEDAITRDWGGLIHVKKKSKFSSDRTLNKTSAIFFLLLFTLSKMFILARKSECSPQ